MAARSFTILAMTIFSYSSVAGKIVAGIFNSIGFIGFIGFIGGGAILKDKSSVCGTSTAPAIWATGAVGIAVGLGRFEVAIAFSIMTFITLKLLGKVKEK